MPAPVARRDDLAALLADHSTQLDARTGQPNSLCDAQSQRRVVRNSESDLWAFRRLVH
jgi:hypothetical protein